MTARTKTFIVNAHTPLRICGTPSLPVRNALRDFEKDWYKVFSYPLLRLTEFTGENHGSEIVLDLTGTLLGDTLRPVGTESYTLAVQGRQLILSGADMRGTIYALYRFSRELLGVDPMWYFNDFLPQKKEEIVLPASFRIREGSPAFRYRGWFINDEDILGGFFHNETFDGVMSHEGFNAIMEALLRCEGNMIVPGSFAMPDESVRDLAAARGLILNDHHVTPLGLNMYRWPEDIPFSYSHGKERLHAYWKTCIDTMKDFEQVWTVSFRGKNDHPYWQEDTFAPESDAERAAEIGEAINTQIRMIREVDPEAVISFNMYNEGAKFYKQGLISLPPDILRIWPGINGFVDEGPVCTAAGDGVYYHISSAARNRYTELNSPMKIFADLARYYAVGATSYCLFNVSNMRHLITGISAGMDYIRNADKYDGIDPAKAGLAWLRQYLAAHYGKALSARILSLYKKFYNCQALNKPLPQDAFYPKTRFCYVTDIFEPNWVFMPDLKQNAAMQGLCRAMIEAPANGISEEWLSDAASFRKILKKCIRELHVLLDTAEQTEPDIPEQAKAFFLTQCLTQYRVLRFGCDAALSMCEAVLVFPKSPEKAKVFVREALESEEAILSALHLAEYGKWATWYETERFGCTYYTRDLAENALRALEGREQLPVRYVGGYRNWLYFWDKLYEYQHGCNFPLLKE